MPGEIWKLIGSYLNDNDLRSLSQVSRSAQRGALEERSIRVMKATLDQHKDLFTKQSTEVPRKLFFLKGAGSLEKCVFFLKQATSKKSENSTEELNRMENTLKEFLSLSEKETLSLSMNIFLEITSERSNWDDIELKHKQLQLQLYSKALLSLIPHVTNSALKSELMESACYCGFVDLLKALFENSDVSEEDRGRYVQIGAVQNQVEIVKEVLNNGPISIKNRSRAVIR